MVANPQARGIGQRNNDPKQGGLAPKLPLKGAEKQDWVVIKSISSTSPQSGQRLTEQVQKQIAFLDMTTANKQQSFSHLIINNNINNITKSFFYCKGV
jgi:hypothetical protein